MMLALIITHALAVAIGATAVWLNVRLRLDQLRALTDRDARGRFVKRELGE